jgi:hypothetical protein
VPAQQRLWRHDQPLPTARGKKPGEGRKESTISRTEQRPRPLPTQHRQLMPQNEQLDDLVELAAPTSHEQPHHRRERETDEREEHPPMLPEPALAKARAEPSFQTPQADLAVAQTVVAKGEHAPSNGDLGDVAAAVFGDPLEGGP